MLLPLCDYSSREHLRQTIDQEGVHKSDDKGKAVINTKQPEI